MKITIGSKPLGNDYQNEIIVKINGYFGDGDEYFHEEESFQLDDPKLGCYLCMCKKLGNSFVETRQEMEKYLEEMGYNPNDISIPVDSCSYEFLPCGIDGLDVHYYNDKGQKFSVSYEV